MNIVVTGGTRGLGLQIVRQQVEFGNNVFVLSKRLSEDLKKTISDHPDQVKHTSADLADGSDAVTSAFNSLLPKEIVVDGLVNNAAAVYDDLVSNLTFEPLERMFQSNVFAPMLLTRLVIRRMLLHQTAGSIVNISSVVAHTGYKGLAMYAATKGAIEAFSKSVAREWGSKGIRSNCVVPGFMETDMSADLSLDDKAKVYRRTALRKPVDVDSVASTVGFLLSTASQSVTGQNFIVDAGTL